MISKIAYSHTLSSKPSEINILVASMVLGGAEKIVFDTICGLENISKINLFIMWDSENEYPIPTYCNIFRLESYNRRYKMQFVSSNLLATGNSIIYTHLIRHIDLKELWEYGVRTIPVIHNAKDGWKDSPLVYNNRHCPFAIACCEFVRLEMIDEGCEIPVYTIRHEIQTVCEEDQIQTICLRKDYEITDDYFIIGMVGRFKKQKAYKKVAEILNVLKNKVKLKLVIVGGYSNNDINSLLPYTEFINHINEQGIDDLVILTGDIHPVGSLYSQFDIFLNCSLYEGYSIATLEALSYGIPCILSDVGGQKEINSNQINLIPYPYDAADFADAIHEILLDKRKRSKLVFYKNDNFISRLWQLYFSAHAFEEYNTRNNTEILFLINNLSVGGAQRSLTNLLTSFLFNAKVGVCTLNKSTDIKFSKKIFESGIPIWNCSENDKIKQVSEIIDLLNTISPKAICFWNVNTEFKMLLTSVISRNKIKIIDVSPGASYFVELLSSTGFCNRISYQSRDYFARLDALVIKYNNGYPPFDINLSVNKIKIIPNGVVIPRKKERLPSVSKITIGTVCRLEPSKRIGWLLDVFSYVQAESKDIYFVIVGQFGNKQYEKEIETKLQNMNLTNFQFNHNEFEYDTDKIDIDVFVSVSNPHGCSNATLEAMALGFPIIATNEGGASDQVINNNNGFLVDPFDSRDMANKILYFFNNRDEIAIMGANSKKMAFEHFSINKMVENYSCMFQELINS